MWQSYCLREKDKEVEKQNKNINKKPSVCLQAKSEAQPDLPAAWSVSTQQFVLIFYWQELGPMAISICRDG